MFWQNVDVAMEWCRHATTHAASFAENRWSYLLIPHDSIDREHDDRRSSPAICHHGIHNERHPSPSRCKSTSCRRGGYGVAAVAAFCFKLVILLTCVPAYGMGPPGRNKAARDKSLDVSSDS